MLALIQAEEGGSCCPEGGRWGALSLEGVSEGAVRTSGRLGGPAGPRDAMLWPFHSELRLQNWEETGLLLSREQFCEQ